jgi:phosphohistidine phosphatase SixA
MKNPTVNAGTLALAIVVVALASGHVGAQTLAGSELVAALRKGGYVIVVRHARSPREAPDERTANADNATRERQLDEGGRADAMAMGKAMRELRIPIGTVLTSPTYRARETVRLAQWEKAVVVPELGDRGQSMQGVTEVEGAWLRNRVTQFPTGTNTIIVTHLPNITRAFPQDAQGIEDGDALVFGRNSQSASAVVGRIKISEWPSLK